MTPTLALSRRQFTVAGLAASAGLFGQPVRAAGQTLTVGIQSDPVTLDPAMMASYFEIVVQFNLHEPLVNLRPDLTIEAGLASFVVRDALHYDFALRPGLTFHDGTPIDAEAAKFNLDRLLDPETASPRRSELAPVAGVAVTGPLTFTITLTSPYAPLLQVLALRAGMLVSPTALRALGPEFGFRAVGAGPFRLAGWTKNSELVLERFDGYWRGPAALERLVFRPIADETVRLANLRAGTVQLIDGVPPQDVGVVGADPALRLRHRPGLGFSAFSFNTRKAPFADQRVRQAFAQAIDLDVILRVAYFGQGVVAAGAVSPSVPWAHDPGLMPWATDLASSARLLAEAGVSLPLPITITVTNAPIQVRIAQIIQAQAQAAGFTVTLNQVDPTSLITELRKGAFDLCFSPWSGRADPDGNMFGWFTKDGPQNFSGYDNPVVAAILQDARAETDQPTRGKLYLEAQRQIAHDEPLLFLVFPEIIQASVAELTWEQFADGAFRLHAAHFD
jgi:peptide/nickel transport system substrate-binding protein